MTRKPAATKRKLDSSAWRIPLPRARLAHAQFLQVVYGFAHDCTASETAARSGVSVRTVNSLFQLLRERLVADIDRFGVDTYVDSADWDEAYERWKASHPGRRHLYFWLYWLEVRARLACRDKGPFWLYGRLLQSIYERPLSREGEVGEEFNYAIMRRTPPPGYWPS